MHTPTIEHADASDLGLPPGEWPSVLTHDGYTYWRMTPTLDRDGDVLAVNYESVGGLVLVVVND